MMPYQTREPRKYYHYQRNGWFIGIDAISRSDADEYIKAWAGDAKFIGHYIPQTKTTATGGITDARKQQIREKLAGIINL